MSEYNIITIDKTTDTDAASGGSADWAMAVAGIELAYTIELPGGDFGFAAPPSEIIPVARETFEALKALIEVVGQGRKAAAAVAAH